MVLAGLIIKMEFFVAVMNAGLVCAIILLEKAQSIDYPKNA